MVKKIYSLFIFVLFASTLCLAQAPKKYTSSDIHAGIKKLQVLGSALYVAAHPDDENTRLISYLSNELHINTAYLSLTRGDGGQNLLGPEIRELLGVMRTNELLMARSIDGGNQMFSRANDFGYSKNPKETLEIWNKNEVTSDVVWAIRKWRPDVIINRFDHKGIRPNHGHHTASAMLSVEVFDKVADKNYYPEQLKHVEAWQPKRLFLNTSWWFYGSREAFEKADKSKMIPVDAGVYYPLKGKSNNEVAAESRSMHKCQGFGSVGSRGSEMEYLELIHGDMPTDGDLFEGINTTWTRVKGGKPIGLTLQEVDKNFRADNPAASLPHLAKAHKMITALPDGYWKRIKLMEIEKVMQACAGLYVEAVANDYSATPGEEIELSVEVINRSKEKVHLKNIEFLPMQMDTTFNSTMEYNKRMTFKKKVSLPTDIASTTPYWLTKPWELGMYTVEDQKMRGVPNTPRDFKVKFNIEIGGQDMTIEKDIVYKRRDPVKGEVYRPFEITPEVFANIESPVYVLGGNEPKTVKVLLKSGKADVNGTIELCHPDNWNVEPAKMDFSLALKGEEKTVEFLIYPPSEQSEGFISPIARIDGKQHTKEAIFIEYDHIPTQTVIRNAESKVVKIDLKKEGQDIGYIMGAGDAIPESLEQIGYTVTVLEDRDINAKNLQRFDAVIMGVRAYNTQDRLKFHQSKLMDYVKNGGTMIVQYNTSRGVKVKDLGPYPFKLSRDRVTVEEAEVRFLKPDHPILNYPNKITAKDFEGWVQERGLYFPNEWDEKYEAILSSNDPGETPKNGGLLVARHGEGYYIYSGYSYFRELPAGVAGAYRLFTNLISIGQQEKRP